MSDGLRKIIERPEVWKQDHWCDALDGARVKFCYLIQRGCERPISMKSTPSTTELSFLGEQRWHVRVAIVLVGMPIATLSAQSAFTWQQIKDKFAASNPTLKAVQLNIDESRDAEITAYLRPNPDFSLTADGVQISRNFGVWRPLQGVVETPGVSYLHERDHKRELRRGQAKESTAIAESTYLDQERGLVFNLRSAFVQVLQAKAVLQNARENLDYWDRETGNDGCQLCCWRV